MQVGSTGQGLPYPTNSDRPDYTGNLYQAFSAAERLAVMRFPNTTTRARLLPEPAEGMLCYLAEERRLESFWSGRWVPAPVTHVVSGISLVQTQSQDLPSGTDTRLEWDTVVSGSFTPSMWSSGNPSVVTVPYRGVWGISSYFRIGRVLTGRRVARIKINGTVQVARVRDWDPRGYEHMTIGFSYPLNLGDQVEIEARQASGSPAKIGEFEPSRLTVTLRYPV